MSGATGRGELEVLAERCRALRSDFIRATVTPLPSGPRYAHAGWPTPSLGPPGLLRGFPSRI